MGRLIELTVLPNAATRGALMLIAAAGGGSVDAETPPLLH